MTKQRLDQLLVARRLATTRSQAENLIRLGKISVDDRDVIKPGLFVNDAAVIKLKDNERYVSRAGLKLASVAQALALDFRSKTVLDVGSSTGGFTDYALQHGAQKVIAVDVGTEQLHHSLRGDKRVELHEKTDIRNVVLSGAVSSSVTGANVVIDDVPDVVVMDVSFISLREILPHIVTVSDTHTQIVAMLKPQFEAGREQVNKGVIKNDSVRRQILRDFEAWAKHYFVIIDKRDSEVAGAKGNRERFYLLQLAA